MNKPTDELYDLSHRALPTWRPSTLPVFRLTRCTRVKAYALERLIIVVLAGQPGLI